VKAVRTKKKSIHTKVAGVTAKNDDGSSRQKYISAFCKCGTSFTLIRQPANRFDANAIAVFVTVKTLVVFSAQAQIGFLSADVAKTLAPLMDAGAVFKCKVTEITGGVADKPSLGVNILIEEL
jgi:hypothetical protein